MARRKPKKGYQATTRPFEEIGTVEPGWFPSFVVRLQSGKWIGASRGVLGQTATTCLVSSRLVSSRLVSSLLGSSERCVRVSVAAIGLSVDHRISHFSCVAVRPTDIPYRRNCVYRRNCARVSVSTRGNSVCL